MSPPLSLPSGGFLSRIGKGISPAQRARWIVAAVVGIALFIGVQGIFIPWQNERRTLAQRLSEETERLNLLLSIQAQLNQLKAEEQKVLLPKGGTATLTSHTTRLASEAALEIESVAPQPEAVFGPYTRSQIEITATAGFSTLLRFLNRLERHLPLLKVDGLTVSQPSSQSRPSSKAFSLRTGELAPESSVLERERQKVVILISAYSGEPQRSP